MEPKESTAFRRSNDILIIERLAQFEEKLKLYQDIQLQLQKDLDEVQANIQSTLIKLSSLLETQQTYKPLIDSFSKVVSAGVLFRWMVIFVIGTLAAIGTASTALEVIQKWIR